MKKNKFFIAIIALVLSSGIAFGQNSHSMFSSSAGDIISSVSLSNMSTYQNYMIGTDEFSNIFISEFDNTSPFPQPVSGNSRAFALPDTYGKIYLTGGFFDLDNNIVVYGYTGIGDRGVVVKVTMVNGYADQISYLIADENTKITDGCWSRRLMAGNNYDPTYTFVSNNALVRTTIGLASVTNRKFNNAKITAVSWDDNLKKHVVSGTTNTPSCFIGCLDESYPSFWMSGTYYELEPTNFNFSEGTNTHVLSGNGYYYDNKAYLIQDLRDDNGDGLWVTEIDYSTGTINYSNAYQFPSEKVLIIDAANNFMNLFVLGHHNGFDGTANFEKRYLAQFDIFDPTNYKVSFLEDVDMANVPWISTYYATQQAYLRNLNLNHYTYAMYSNGAVIDDAYLVETFDLNYDNCNTEIPITMPTINYNTNSYIPSNNSTPNLDLPTPVSVYSNYPLTTTNLCGYGKSGNSNKDIAFIKNYIKEQQLQNPMPEVIETKVQGQIFVFTDNKFLSDGFEGLCHYSILDIYGRTVKKGTVHNGEFVKLETLKSGIYIIRITDINKNTATEKIRIVN